MAEFSQSNPLGKSTPIPKQIDSKVLFPIDRYHQRFDLGVPIDLAGEDRWRCYEFHCRIKNVTTSFILEIRFDAQSSVIVESKSLKLYLGSFFDENFEDIKLVSERIEQDLSKINISALNLSLLPWGLKADSLPLLKLGAEVFSGWYQAESGYFSFPGFRSLCPVTQQPDWATVSLYTEAGELSYDQAGKLAMKLKSYRDHASFHEAVADELWVWCCEQIDIPAKGLALYFMRRGGIDIVPFRGEYPNRQGGFSWQ